MAHFVYAIKLSADIEPFSRYLKIGHTNDINKRLASHQISCPILLEYAVIWRVALRSTAIGLETNLHRTFKSRNVRGEWFNVHINELRNVVVDHLGQTLFSETTDGTVPDKARWPSFPNFSQDVFERRAAA